VAEEGAAFNMKFWNFSFFILAGFIIISDLLPMARHKVDKTSLIEANTASIIKPVSAADIYPEFTCPCCDKPLDKDNPCCGAMTNMIDFIDQQVEASDNESDIYLAAVKEFGLDRLTRKEKRADIKKVLAAQAPSNAPKIIINIENKDLGSISQKQGEVYADFVFKNSGQSDLIIDNLSSSCGCTSASIIYNSEEGPRFTMVGHGKENPTNWEIAIKPGDTATFRVYYDPTVHPDLVGAVTRTATIFSNDPVEFEKKVTITLNQTL
jgi:hypothetical protein